MCNISMLKCILAQSVSGLCNISVYKNVNCTFVTVVKHEASRRQCVRQGREHVEVRGRRSLCVGLIDIKSITLHKMDILLHRLHKSDRKCTFVDLNRRNMAPHFFPQKSCQERNLQHHSCTTQLIPFSSPMKSGQYNESTEGD